MMACNHSITNSVAETLSENFTTPLPEVAFTPPLAIYLIADGSGSGLIKYAIPQLDTAKVKNVFNLIANNGGGRLYLNQVDANAANNELISINVPAIPKPPVLREKLVGEQKYQYEKEEKAYDAAHKIYETKRDSIEQALKTIWNINLSKIQDLISNSYSKRTRVEDYSDVVGLLNSAQRSLNVLPRNYLKFIVALSDLEHDTKSNSEAKVSIGKDTHIIRINASDSGSPVVEAIEIDTYENALTYILNNLNSK
jgi:hypothetical protein